MTSRARLSLLAIPAALTALLAIAPAGQADDAVATSALGTPVVADSGVTAWRADDGHIMLQAVGGTVARTSVTLPAGRRFDVGARHGGAVLVYTGDCSTRTGTCTVRTVALSALQVGRQGPARTLTRIPYHGGGAPAIAVDGDRLAYAVHGSTRSRGRTVPCDVPYVRTSSGSRSATRRLDRGHCAAITQLDLGEGRVALLVQPAIRYGTGASEARVIRAGGGPSRTLQREAQGEESNFIGAVSIDRGAVFTTRGGIRQANVFSRFSLATGKRSDARAFTTLIGPFARDAGRLHYLQGQGGSSSQCGGYAGAPACLVVAGGDAFAAGERLLAPRLTLAVTPQPVFIDTAPSAVLTATRARVTRTAQLGTVPVSDLPIELLAAPVPSAEQRPAVPTPTGATGTTGADGTATIAIPGAPFTRRFLAAVSRPAAGAGAPVQTADAAYVQTYVRMTATAERLAGGRLRVSGTITPAQPGRKVRLDRRVERVCTNVVSGPIVSPSAADTPKGCADRWTQDPLTTAAVSADGASFVLETAAAPAGAYRVALDFAGGADVYAGETATFDVP
jgi:hypothetical protein